MESVPLTPLTCFIVLNNTYLVIYHLPVSPNRYNLQDHKDAVLFSAVFAAPTTVSVGSQHIFVEWMNDWRELQRACASSCPLALLTEVATECVAGLI